MLPQTCSFVQSEENSFDCQYLKLSNEEKSLSAAAPLTKLHFLWEVLDLAQHRNTF